MSRYRFNGYRILQYILIFIYLWAEVNMDLVNCNFYFTFTNFLYRHKVYLSFSSYHIIACMSLHLMWFSLNMWTSLKQKKKAILVSRNGIAKSLIIIVDEIQPSLVYDIKPSGGWDLTESRMRSSWVVDEI